MGNSFLPFQFFEFHHRFTGTDDLLQLGLVGYLCVDFVAFSHGAGIHQWNVPREYIPTYAKVGAEVCKKALG